MSRLNFLNFVIAAIIALGQRLCLSFNFFETSVIIRFFHAWFSLNSGKLGLIWSRKGANFFVVWNKFNNNICSSLGYQWAERHYEALDKVSLVTRLPVTLESKHNNSVINNRWVRLSPTIMTQSWPWDSQISVKKMILMAVVKFKL